MNKYLVLHHTTMPRDKQRVKRPFRTVAAAAMLAAALMSGFRGSDANAQLQSPPAVSHQPSVGQIKAIWHSEQMRWIKEYKAQDNAQSYEHYRALWRSISSQFNFTQKLKAEETQTFRVDSMIRGRLSQSADNVRTTIAPMDIIGSVPSNKKDTAPTIYSRNCAGYYLTMPKGPSRQIHLESLIAAVRLPEFKMIPGYDEIAVQNHMVIGIEINGIPKKGADEKLPMFQAVYDLLPYSALINGRTKFLERAHLRSVGDAMTMSKTAPGTYESSSWNKRLGIRLEKRSDGTWRLLWGGGLESHLLLHGEIKSIAFIMEARTVPINYLVYNHSFALQVPRHFSDLTLEQKACVMKMGGSFIYSPVGINAFFSQQTLYNNMIPDPFIRMPKNPYTITMIPSKLSETLRTPAGFYLIRLRYSKDQKVKPELGKIIMANIDAPITVDRLPPGTVSYIKKISHGGPSLTIYRLDKALPGISHKTKLLAAPTDLIDANPNSMKHNIYRFNFGLFDKISPPGPLLRGLRSAETASNAVTPKLQANISQTSRDANTASSKWNGLDGVIPKKVISPYMRPTMQQFSGQMLKEYNSEYGKMLNSEGPQAYVQRFAVWLFNQMRLSYGKYESKSRGAKEKLRPLELSSSLSMQSVAEGVMKIRENADPSPVTAGTLADSMKSVADILWRSFYLKRQLPTNKDITKVEIGVAVNPRTRDLILAAQPVNSGVLKTVDGTPYLDSGMVLHVHGVIPKEIITKKIKIDVHYGVNHSVDFISGMENLRTEKAVGLGFAFHPGGSEGLGTKTPFIGGSVSFEGQAFYALFPLKSFLTSDHVYPVEISLSPSSDGWWNDATQDYKPGYEQWYKQVAKELPRPLHYDFVMVNGKPYATKQKSLPNTDGKQFSELIRGN